MPGKRLLIPIACLTAAAACPVGSQELQGHVQELQGGRLIRPAPAAGAAQAPITDGLGRPLNTALDNNTFELRTGKNAVDLSALTPWLPTPKRSAFSQSLDALAARRPIYSPMNVNATVLSGDASQFDLGATEAHWRPTVLQADTGVSHVRVQANIAFCPPRDPVMRQNWAQLMREMSAEPTAQMWRDFQNNAAQKLLDAQLQQGQHQFGMLSIHITLRSNGYVHVDGIPASMFGTALAPRINEIVHDPAFTLPAGTAVHEAHIRACIQESPPLTP